jgi:hypothetical protein
VALRAVLPLPFVTVIILLFGKAVVKALYPSPGRLLIDQRSRPRELLRIRVIKTFVVEPHFLKKFADAKTTIAPPTWNS